MRFTNWITVATMIMLAVPITRGQLFIENFEGDLSQWTSAPSTPHSGQIVPDPIRPGNHVLAFGAIRSGGDIFSREIACAPRLRASVQFEYRGILGHGYAGFSLTNEIGAPVWIAGDERSVAPTFVQLINDGEWRQYEVTVSPGTSFRLVFEDHGGDPLDAMFDDIRVGGQGESFDSGEAGWRVLEVLDNGGDFRTILRDITEFR
ncbi:MAG: hypothetical protein AMXMBFR47_03760 [Planctomycetota bacterium]